MKLTSYLVSLSLSIRTVFNPAHIGRLRVLHFHQDRGQQRHVPLFWQSLDKQ